MEVELIEVDAADEKRKIVLETLPVMIGHGPDVAIRVDDQWASHHHCEINAVKGTLVVRDLGSMLGTYVNGLNVNTALLMPGDKLTVGVTSFLVDYERMIRSRRSTRRPAETTSPEPEPAAKPVGPPSPEPETLSLFSRVLRRVWPFRRRNRGV
jgi:pSer/pThr/pTyr-binding forkhead associated (FHA) protein